MQNPPGMSHVLAGQAARSRIIWMAGGKAARHALARRAVTRRASGQALCALLVAEPVRARRAAVVADELHAGPRAVPAQVGRLVTVGGVAGDRVELWIASAGERGGARHDDPAGGELAALVALQAVAEDLGLRGAEQQDAAALEGHRGIPGRRAELVVAEDA